MSTPFHTSAPAPAIAPPPAVLEIEIIEDEEWSEAEEMRFEEALDYLFSGGFSDDARFWV